MTRIGILDDYLDIVLTSADWSLLPDDCTVETFTENLATVDEAAERLKNFEVLLATRERMPFPAELIERLPNLKLLVSTGMRNWTIDMAACKKAGVTVCGTATVPGAALELTWALLLGLAKHIPEADAAMHSDGWQVKLARSLHGQTLGLLGLGRIGGDDAEIAKIFGMRVIAWSPNLTEERCAKRGATLVDKDSLFREADFLSVHVVLGETTRGIVGARELSLMKPTAYLINTARGPLVDEAALAEALKSGRIAGAGVDVYDVEPLPKDSPLRGIKNLMMTGHMGYNTLENAQLVYPEALEDILAWLDGKPIRVLD